MWNQDLIEVGLPVESAPSMTKLVGWNEFRKLPESVSRLKGDSTRSSLCLKGKFLRL
ncbi:hypothetical protein [Sporisorium scitamineum]|uniref:Uncharacterized protein n=1 Tax=Sporisorium scitamineum TaxID=49012 RepID=A0A0F7SAB1_9BASI|nr:hypothetical protein [Sporisorium scitamineum]